MATGTKPFDTFGPYILLRKLEEHSLGELWRAGKIEDGSIRVVALHRLNRGSTEALRQAVLVASTTSAGISGTSIVRNQGFGVVDGTAVLEYDYNGGRTLRHIVTKARSEGNPKPIPTDQALAIAERVATAVELVHNLKPNGYHAVHGAVIPQFVWLEEDGEIRLAAQTLGKGVLASLSSPAVAGQLAPYIAPEVRSFGEPSAAGDLYATGGILHLALTGTDPPDSSNGAQVTQAVSRATLMSGEPVPEKIRSILHRSLSPDINTRFNSAAELRQNLAAVLHGGDYAPTTFNLAFYLHSLLRREFEGEAIEREKESKVTPALYAAPAAAVHPQPSGAVLPAPRPRTRLPMVVVALLLLGGAGFGAYYVLMRPRQQVVDQGPPAATEPPPPAVATVVPEGLTVVPADTMSRVALDTAAAEQQRKKRIEDAVQRQLEREMMKLQAEYERQLERERLAAEAAALRAAPRQEEQPAPIVQREAPAPVVPTSTVPPTETAIATTTPTQTQPPPRPIAEPAPQPMVLEGDLVGVSELDRRPEPRVAIRPLYPPIAKRQRLEATIFLTVLISETGEVLEVRVLQGDTRPVGFEEAAIRAVRNTTFTPAIKDGRRVRTWLPIPIRFQP